MQAVQKGKHYSKAIQSHNKEYGIWTNDFELLMQKHDLAHSAHEFRTKYVCAVPSLRGGQEGPCPPNWCLCPPLRVTQNTVLGTSFNDKTTHNDGKRNNCVQTLLSFDVFSILCEIAVNQLLCRINLTQYTVLFTCLYGCVAKERCKPVELLLVVRL